MKMGNNQVHADNIPGQDPDSKEVNLSQQLGYKEFCKHLEGECNSQSLQELPWAITGSVTMYEKLNIACNCLATIPEDLPFCMPHLNYLDLSYNHLSTLPSSVGLLVHLHTLLLKHNKLKHLPKSLTSLVNLQKLDISYNVLTQLPEELGHMPSLSKLNIAHNQLTNLPRSLGQAKQLRVILVNNNIDLQDPPEEICAKGSDAVLRYLRKCYGPVLVVGNGSEGLWNVFPRVRSNEAYSPNLNPESPKLNYVKMQTQTSHTASRVKTPLLPPLDASSLQMDQLGDMICGLIYGAVIGDALGVGTEFMTPDECNFHYDTKTLTYSDIIQDEHTVRWKKGGWTSNTDQMLLMLDSILQWAGMVDELDFAKRLLHWKYHGFPELEDSAEYMLSETINEVLKQKTYLDDPHASARILTQTASTNGNSENISHKKSTFCDNGALPRSIILGVTHFYNLKEVCSNSARICLATHSDPRCVASCVAISILIAQMLQGHCYSGIFDENLVENIIKSAKDYALEYLNNSNYIHEFQYLFSVTSIESIKLNEKGKENYTFKPLAAGIFALKSKQNFRSTLINIITNGGHSSMYGCVAGALLGCRLGYKKLPTELVEGLLPKHVGWLNIKINSLLDKMGIP